MTRDHAHGKRGEENQEEKETDLPLAVTVGKE